MLKVLVTGAKGLLGTEVVNLLSDSCQVYGLSKQDLDITDFDQVRSIISRMEPDVIIHCAAYTKVDLAETESDCAFGVNALGTRNIAVAAADIGAKVVYISTDYVFNGENTDPYFEYEPPSPVNIYGKTKLAGEELLKTICPKYFIVRTSWVFGKYGDNFVKTMLRIGQEKQELGVVHDQIGSPTYTYDLALFINDLMLSEKYGIYHATNSGYCSWFDFAQEIFHLTNNPINLKPLTTDQFPRPARRPHNSRLQHTAIRANGFSELRHWKQALAHFLTTIQ